MRKKNLLSVVGSICLTLVLAALLLPACAAEEEPTPAPTTVAPAKHEITIAIYQSSTHEISQWIKENASLLEEMSNGRLIPKVYDSGMIAKGPDMIDAVQKNLADLGNCFPGFTSATFPVFDIYGMVPFLIRDDYEVWKAFPRINAVAQRAMEDAGYDNVVFSDACYFSSWYMTATAKK